MGGIEYDDNKLAFFNTHSNYNRIVDIRFHER